MSDTVTVSKVNEVFLKVDCDDGLAKELFEFFSFKVPNAKFMPSYRNRMWDGKVYLFSIKTHKIYIGLLPYVDEFCRERGYEFEGVHEVLGHKHKTKEFNIADLNLPFEPRDYQLDAFHTATKYGRQLLLSPTASGKSLIIYMLARYYDCKTVIIVPTTSLVEQMYSDFEDYGWSSGTYCQRIYQGHERKVTKDVVISTWQSLYKMPKAYFLDFGCVIGDEAHMFKAKSLTGIMTKLNQCKYRFGLTGTLDGTQTHQLVLEGLFGAVEKVVTTKQLIDKNTLAKLKIKCVILKHNKIKEKMTYAEEMDYIVSKESRNNFILDLCNTINGNTLCLFQLVEKHGKILYDGMKDKENVYFVYGGTDTDQREKIRGLVEGHARSTTIASYGTFSTGINIRNINNIVLASPSKSKIRVLQSIGRGLRTSSTKDSILVYDIADDISYNERRNFTLNHFTERLNIYNEEQFDYDISKVKL